MVKLEIEDYRGIGSVRLDLSPIIIFVGRNNTGKSSILEAVTLAATSPTRYADALGVDLLSKFLRQKENLLYWIKIGKEKARITLLDAEEKTREVLIGYVKKGVPADLKAVMVPLLKKSVSERKDELNLQGDSPSKILGLLERSEKLYFFNPEENDMVIGFSKDDSRSLGKRSLGKGRVIRSHVPLPSKLFYYGNAYRPALIRLYHLAIQAGVLPRLLETLKKQITYLSDLRSITDELFIFIEGMEKPLPLSSSGDGFQAMLLASFLSALGQHGILVMEEPELNLHPGFIELIASHLVETVEHLGSQLFISTHSLDFLEAVLTRASNLTNVIRMHLVQNEIDYESIQGNEALDEIKKIGYDLRGT